MKIHLRVFSQHAVFLFLLSALSSSCYDVRVNNSLIINNKTKKTISVLCDNDKELDQTENLIAYYTTEYNTIKSDSIKSISKLGGASAWHDYIENGPSKQLFVYCFDVDSLKTYPSTYPINVLRKQGKFIKMKVYTEQQLNKIGWKIDFK